MKRGETEPGGTEPGEGLQLSAGALVTEACGLADRLAGATLPERGRRHRRLARLVADPAGRAFTIALTDQVLRIADPRRAAARFADIVSISGVPRFAGPLDTVALAVGARLAPVLPSAVMPLVRARLRHEAGVFVLPAEPRAFAARLRRRPRWARLNVNVIGEAVLGDAEAAKRLAMVLAFVGRPEVGFVSVKASSLCARIDPLAFDDTVARIAAALRPLYRAARSSATFVTLDMEEYRDLHVTAAAFRLVLDEDAFLGTGAGIALQAYLPDSSAVLAELAAWASHRRARGGAPIRIRLVKGANLAMERVDAEIHGWPQAPFTTKADTDAHYKRMVEVALDGRWDGAVTLAVASHNLFDIAWVLTVARHGGTTDRVDIEMLEGMAPAQAESVAREAGSVLLYAPVVGRGDFDAAIAYLVRRLDENAQPDGFLHAIAGAAGPSGQPRNASLAGTPAWAEQRRRFVEAVGRRATVATEPRRQDRRHTPPQERGEVGAWLNEPDTDWCLAGNRAWVLEALGRPESRRATPGGVGGGEDGPGVAAGTARGEDHAPGATTEATRTDEVGHLLAAARQGRPAWSATTLAERRRVLLRVADHLGALRGDLIAAMAHETGKAVAEGDPEVSEAVDFARWYAARVDTLAELSGEGLSFSPLGVVVVAAPWNFPIAIPTAGITSALAAGNTVVLKPAPEAVVCGRLVAECCWAAGVPRHALLFAPCPDGDVGKRLVTGADAVVLTGAHETAMAFLSWKPAMRLAAETSGKNAVVITAAADLDAAVRDLVRSAFGHAGQKCSAASLAIVEHAAHDDPRFLAQLADATASLAVGPADDVRSVVTPLIRQPGPALEDALTRLDPGESWLVEPRRVADATWTPGVKIGVAPGSTFHTTECFGPVLGVMRAPDLATAISWQNATGFGLTGGIHTLDPHEARRWLDEVEVGNAYVNRHVTGAIVGRQPFGGWRRSAVGVTAKAGGPNHLLTLGRWSGRAPDPAASYRAWWDRLFAVETELAGLRSERNVLRYRRLGGQIVVRVDDSTSDEDISLARIAAALTRSHACVSSATPRPGTVTEDEATLAARLGGTARLRVLGQPPGDALLRAAHAGGVTVDGHPIVHHGRVELLHWLREQSVCETVHRYGTIMART